MHPPTFEPSAGRWHLALLAALAAVWGALLARNLAVDLRFEDALIVLRYARNLAAGLGFVYNPGERVLGVTTPLHTLLAVVWVWLGGSEGAPALQNVFGLLCLVGESFAVLLVGRRLGFPAAGLIAAVATLGNFRLSYLYLGMETHLFALLVLAAFWLALPEEGEDSRADARTDLRLGVVLGLTFLVRFDAALPALLLGLELWRRRRALPWRLGAAFLATVLPWLVFAQAYFGSILPKSLGAKQSYVDAGVYLHALFDGWRQTFVQLFELYSAIDRANYYFSFLFPLILLGGAACLVARKPAAWPLAAYPFLHAAVYARIGSDPGFVWHTYPLSPTFFLFTAIAAVALVAAIWRLFGAPRWPAHLGLGRPGATRPLATLALVAALLPLGWHLWKNATWRFHLDPHSAQLYAMAHHLRDHYPPETRLLQPSIGILGYESGLTMVDHAGLVTPGLFFFNDQQCTPLPEVVERFAPDLLLLSQWSPWTPEQVTPLGYGLVHTFEQPFVYRLYQRQP